VRNAVNDHVVSRRRIVANAVELYVIRKDLTPSSLINAVDYCFGKRLFPANQNSYALHLCCVSFLQKRRKIPAAVLLVKRTKPRLQFGSPKLLPGIQGEQ
jgi:hypothetical protein